jgi:hypothetical protein
MTIEMLVSGIVSSVLASLIVWVLASETKWDMLTHTDEDQPGVTWKVRVSRFYITSTSSAGREFETPREGMDLFDSIAKHRKQRSVFVQNEQDRLLQRSLARLEAKGAKQ